MSDKTKARLIIKKIVLICVLTVMSFITYADFAKAQSLQGNPTANHRETSPFGWRESTGTNHLGVDYGGSTAGVAGDPVFSTLSGTVVESRYQTNSSNSGGWGNTVLIESNSGNYRVRYSHLDQPGLSSGTVVTPGQDVGIMGGTGKAGGYTPHLDYAVYVKNPDTGEFQAVDPNLAATKDLDNPDDIRDLITDAEGRIAGELRNEGSPQGGAGGQVTIDDSGGSDACPLGCDCSIAEENQQIIDAVNQVNAEIGKANITQPTSIEQMTCADQQLELVNRAGGIHSQPEAQNISDTLGPLAQQPLVENVLNSLNSVSAATNAIDNLINSSFQNLASDFLNTNFLNTGTSDSDAPLNTDCGMTEEVWLINQCLEMPTLPSVSDILGGRVAEITGAVDNIAGAPERVIQEVCRRANDTIQGFTGDLTNGLNSSIDGAAEALSSPITDSLDQIPGN